MAEDNLAYRLFRPFPAVGYAVGFFIYGDGVLIPKQCWLKISKIESEDRAEKCKIQDEMYDFDLTFYTPNSDGTIGPSPEMLKSAEPPEPEYLDYTPGEFADKVMEALNLCSLPIIAENRDEPIESFYTELAEESQEYKIKMTLRREAFEYCYRFVANSSFVQLGEDPHICYMMRRPQNRKELNVMLDYFYSARPWETLEPVPVVPTIRPLVWANQDVVGMVTYRPYSVIMFNGEQFIPMGKK